MTQTDGTTIIRTQGLTKWYGDTVAVDDLSLSVERGSITGIVGPNGAGKSTTLLILSTLLSPSRGTARVCGFDPTSEAMEVRARTGYMPDFFGIYDDLRVDEYLGFFAATYGIPAAKRPALVRDLLALVDLSGKADAFVESLSRGMKQRLCLARAMVHDPELLILDEPASGLDPRARIELRALLLELQRQGKTILISSHILSELEEICSHVAIIEAGELVAQGTPRSIVSGFAAARRFRIQIARGLGAIRAPDDPEVGAARSAIGSFDGDVTVLDEAVEADLEIELPGGDEEAAALLGHLIRSGVAVVGFNEVTTGLEEIFLRVTKGIAT